MSVTPPLVKTLHSSRNVQCSISVHGCGDGIISGKDSCMVIQRRLEESGTVCDGCRNNDEFIT